MIREIILRSPKSIRTTRNMLFWTSDYTQLCADLVTNLNRARIRTHVVFSFDALAEVRRLSVGGGVGDGERGETVMC